ncbi:MAG: hypothetical protein EBV86_10440 [Marivivens sp.]|nr:hypothetical protein [Marivivens sp.]
MSEWTGFQDLDLSSIEDSNGPTKLDVGQHDVTSGNAEIQTRPNGAKDLFVTFKCEHGEHKERFTVYNPNSSENQEIGRSKLKSFLKAGGHKNPDQPGSMDLMNDLNVRITIGMQRPWKGADGVERSYPEIKNYKPIDQKSDAVEGLNDDIPF